MSSLPLPPALVPVVLGSLLGAAPALAQCPDDDFLEDNDTCATARPLVNGNQFGLVCRDDDEDYYRVVVKDGQSLTATIVFTHASGDLDLHLYDGASGCTTLVATSTSATDSEMVMVTNTSGGDLDYVLHVDFVGVGCNEYNLGVSLSGDLRTCGGDDVFEPNDTCGTATPVVNGSYYQLNAPLMGGTDLYRAEVPAGHRITALAAEPAADSGDTAGLLLLSADCTTTLDFDFAMGSTLQSTEWINDTGMDTEVVIQFVYNVGNSACLDYILSVSVAPVTCPLQDVYEENDNCGVPFPLSPGYYDGLTVGTVAGAEPDFYSVDVPDGHTLDVDVFFTHADGNIEAALWDDGCMSGFLDTSFSTDDDEQLSWQNTSGGTLPATIQIVLNDPSAMACADYQLCIALTPPPPGCTFSIDDGFEDNDDCAGASPVSVGSYPGLVLLSGDDDYFTLSVPTDDGIRVTALFSHAQDDLDLRLWTPGCSGSGTLLDVSNSMDDDEVVAWGNDTGAPADVVIQVDSANVLSCVDYELLIEIVPCGGVDDDLLEENDDCATARAVGIGIYEELVVFDSDEDFYTFDLFDGETVVADVFFEHALGDLDLYLVESTNPTCGGTAAGDYLVRSDSADDDESLEWTNTSGGTVSYVLWVDWASASAGCQPYVMTISIGDGSSLGTYVCAGKTNSTGGAGQIIASGNLVASANDFTLSADGLPLNSFGYFLNARGVGLLNPPGSQGTVCIDDGAVGRYNRSSSEIVNSGATGSVSLMLDLTDTPTPTGAVSIVAGERWYFQFWYRDTDTNGNATSNLSSAVCVQFE